MEEIRETWLLMLENFQEFLFQSCGYKEFHRTAKENALHKIMLWLYYGVLLFRENWWREYPSSVGFVLTFRFFIYQVPLEQR